jgi:hypothetical protein
LPSNGQVPSGSPAGIVVRAEDSFGVLSPSDTPISWANKVFDVVDAAGK